MARRKIVGFPVIGTRALPAPRLAPLARAAKLRDWSPTGTRERKVKRRKR